jgi:hypothetical protein
MKLEDYSYVEPLQLVRYTVSHGEYYQIKYITIMGGGTGLQKPKSYIQKAIYISESRPYTILLFLNSVPEADKGGHTSFPYLKTKILPRLGDAILWSNVDPNDLGDEPRILPRPRTVCILQKSSTIWISDRPGILTDEVFVTKYITGTLGPSKSLLRLNYYYFYYDLKYLAKTYDLLRLVTI